MFEIMEHVQRTFKFPRFWDMEIAFGAKKIAF